MGSKCTTTNHNSTLEVIDTVIFLKLVKYRVVDYCTDILLNERRS